MEEGKHFEPLMIIVAHTLQFDFVPCEGPSVTRKQVLLFNNGKEESRSILKVCRDL